MDNNEILFFRIAYPFTIVQSCEIKHVLTILDGFIDRGKMVLFLEKWATLGFYVYENDVINGHFEQEKLTAEYIDLLNFAE